MEKIIKIHALMLLNLYGVKEENVKDNPRALNVFVNILKEEIENEIKKILEELKDDASLKVVIVNF